MSSKLPQRISTSGYILLTWLCHLYCLTDILHYLDFLCRLKISNEWREIISLNFYFYTFLFCLQPVISSFAYWHTICTQPSRNIPLLFPPKLNNAEPASNGMLHWYNAPWCLWSSSSHVTSQERTTYLIQQRLFSDKDQQY